MKEQMKKNQKGFTLIELIIVIAVMGIIAAVLVPSFTQMTAKSRVSTDIRSLQLVQKQLQIYMAENDGKYPGSTGAPADKTPADATAPITTIDTLQGLIKGGYIDAKNPAATTAHELIGLQSKATIEWNLINPDGVASNGDEYYTFSLGYYQNQTDSTNSILKSLSTGTDKDYIKNLGDK